MVVNSKDQADIFAQILENVKTVIDNLPMHGPLVGAATGFKTANGEYGLLLPCDTPLVSREVLTLLLELCVNRNAVIPPLAKWLHRAFASRLPHKTSVRSC